ncbi:hypothetical protein F4827_005889 [Paraburkholderia bannensis]|uniref:Uncharacterized protein n=1 Tax=Paraburkholderia bannensis TaxID=765414 RepID=A0A7W9WVS7_9BURK|nr:hypothetical protein [Paraburkholderia sp. WP4_3_2]MBB6106019.1 hypothetical protein [Paraburkholderia bannensis]
MNRDLQKGYRWLLWPFSRAKVPNYAYFSLISVKYCQVLHAQSEVLCSLTNGFAIGATLRAPLQGAQRLGKALDAPHLRRHEIGARNRSDTAAQVRKGNAVSIGEPCNDLFEMLNIFFELLMIHSWPRDLSNLRKTPVKRRQRIQCGAKKKD